jgi:hypothetical protein
MKEVDHRALFERIAKELPPELVEHVFVVGSLAAAHHFEDELGDRGVRTKDADLVSVAFCRSRGCRDPTRRSVGRRGGVSHSSSVFRSVGALWRFAQATGFVRSWVTEVRSTKLGSPATAACSAARTSPRISFGLPQNVCWWIASNHSLRRQRQNRTEILVRRALILGRIGTDQLLVGPASGSVS